MICKDCSPCPRRILFPAPSEGAPAHATRFGLFRFPFRAAKIPHNWFCFTNYIYHPVIENSVLREVIIYLGLLGFAWANLILS